MTTPKPPHQRPHVSLPVRNLSRSRRFYEALFGMPPSKLKEGYAKFSIDEPSLNLSLVETRGSVGSVGSTHYGIEVDERPRIDELRERLRTAGVEPSPSVEGVCCYSMQTKFWVEDPDGNPWEVFHVSADAEEIGDCTLGPPAAGAAGSERSCCSTDCCS